ncbi:unnamed protein product [Zymoseptoria tritici ST99CH_1A5]|uniref:Uncharacterized protein n=1 Tax=Zymoseptoria tritici ST99CH_1A5 TaxID=1276529 RepID=A0A1Y6LVV1_ZYMTR|nr:unnamed protein product [Zymoseptoria tritici ST99CH_1A5]
MVERAIALHPTPSPAAAKPILPSIEDSISPSPAKSTVRHSASAPRHQSVGELLPAIAFTTFDVPLAGKEAQSIHDSPPTTGRLAVHEVASGPTIWTSLPENHPSSANAQTTTDETTLVAQASGSDHQSVAPVSSPSQATAPADDPVVEALIQSLDFATAYFRQVIQRTIKTDLDTRIQNLPQELSDRILECYLDSTMPSGDAAVNIDHTREPVKVPAALHIDRSLRSKYAKLYYGHGQFNIAEEVGWTPALFAARILKWVSMVAPEHRRLIATVRVGVPDVPSAPEFRSIHTCMITLALRGHPLLKRLAMHEKLCVYSDEGEYRVEDLGLPRAPKENDD